jgi:hypothetical protein
VGRSEAAGPGRRAPGPRAERGAEGRRGGGGLRADDRGLTEQRQPAAAARQRRHGLRSPGSPGRTGPALRCRPERRSGASRAAGGSLKDARHRPQIPSDWCKVEGGEEPSPQRPGPRREREAGPSPGAGAWRSAAAEPTCPPRSAAGARSAAPGAPRMRRWRLGAVPPGKLLGLRGPGSSDVPGSPRALFFGFWSVGTAGNRRPPSSRAGIFGALIRALNQRHKLAAPWVSLLFHAWNKILIVG